MSPEVLAAAELLRRGLDQLAALERLHPAEVRQVVTALVAHLRSWHPEQVTPLGVLGAPTEPIRDPRGPR